jgi:hypothetical protein
LGDYLRFLDIARGSLAELEYYIHFFERETLLPSADITRLRDLQSATGRILHGLWRSLKQKARDGTWDHAGLVRDEPESYAANGSDSDEEAAP